VTDGDQVREMVVVVVGGVWSYLETPAERLVSILGGTFFGVAARAEPPRLASPSLLSPFGRRLSSTRQNNDITCIFLLLFLVFVSTIPGLP